MISYVYTECDYIYIIYIYIYIIYIYYVLYKAKKNFKKTYTYICDVRLCYNICNAYKDLHIA